MNKNVIIFILVVFTLIGSIWGSIANRQKISMEAQLEQMEAAMKSLNVQASKEREQVLGKTAGLQETLTEKEDQLQKARDELIVLRKSSQAVESKLSECTSTLQETNLKNENYINEIQAAKNTINDLKETIARLEERTAGEEQPAAEQPKVAQEEKTEVEKADKPTGEQIDSEELTALQDQLQTTTLTVDRLREELDACNAQIIGMEKLVDEKNAGIDEISGEMDRLRINMDVLLSKIADQRDSLQELQEEKRGLAKELAEKNEEIADLKEEVMRSPVNQE